MRTFIPIPIMLLILMAGCEQERPTVTAQNKIPKLESVVTETWHCFALSDHERAKPLAVLVRKHLKGYSRVEVGSVTVAGTKYESMFDLDGFNRQWGFGDHASHDYGFVVEPDGHGSYYDFSHAGEDELVKPSQFYSCVQR